MSTADEWIGVTDVAAELKLTDRGAWELIRRLGVPRLEPHRSVMATARFRRADWEAARDAATKPPEPRARAASAPAAAAATAQRHAAASPAPTRSKLRAR
jgi:hypothetical protein